MALLRPAWMQATGSDPQIEYSAALDRRVLKAIFSREGVLDKDAGHLRVQQRGAGANMSVDILAGECAIYGDDVADQGAYQCTSTATENRTIPAAPASGSRTHRVVARVRDKMHNGIWTGYDWGLEVLQDTGSGTPAVPPSAIPLGRVTVAAGQTSVTTANITDDRDRAVTGTRPRTGDVPPWPGWVAVSGRNPKYSITPDGVVLLSGQIMRSAATFTTAAATLYEFGTLPAEIVPNSPRLVLALGQAYRTDTVLHLSPNGRLYFSYNSAQVITQNVFWISLDSVTYRIEN